MSATGFEETDLTYQVSESESMGDTKVRMEKVERSAVVDRSAGWSRQKLRIHSHYISWEDRSEAAVVNP